MVYNNKKCLIVGFGSIGEKHCDVLVSMGFSISILSKHLNKPIQNAKIINDLNHLDPKDVYFYIVISNYTNDHYETYVKLRNLYPQSRILVEKPLCFPKLIEDDNAYVGFDLRALEIVSYIKDFVTENRNKILYADFYCGQNLNQWRDRPIHKTMSLYKNKGGGIINDLSHELDMIILLFDNTKYINGIESKGEFGDEVEEIISLNLKDGSTIINCRLNYYDIIPKRYIRLIGNNFDLTASLVHNNVEYNGKIIKFKNINNSLKAFHLNVLQRDPLVANLKDGNNVDNLITTIKNDIHDCNNMR
jgi:hypothetical protein